MIRRRRPRFYKGETKDILRSIFSREVSKGECIEFFEKEFAGYVGTEFAIATCSGRNGLEMLLDAFELTEGDEVILPAYTLKDLIYLIEGKGLVPRLVDVEKSSFNMDPDLIAEHISPRTKVIVATHLFGLPCNIEKIMDIAKTHDIKVIEDCAHACGAEYKGKRVGSFGDAAFFSFEALKPVNTFGGGMVITGDEKVARKIRQILEQYPYRGGEILNKVLFTCLEHLIIKSPFYPLLAGLFMYRGTTRFISKLYLFLHKTTRVRRSRFTNLQALMGLKQMDGLDERNRERSIRAGELAKKLGSGISLQHSEFSEGRVFYFFVVKPVIKDSIERIRKTLIMRGLDVGIKGEITDNCAGVLNREKDYPVTKEIFNSAIQLPFYDGLTQKEIGAIARVSNKIVS